MLNQTNMEYNTQRGILVIPEYGRNVQNLIYFAKTIEDRESRQYFVEELVKLMIQLSPLSKNFDEIEEKVWKNIFRIAEYDLDVTPPRGIEPKPGDGDKTPEKLQYPGGNNKFRHYGSHIQKLIKKAIESEDEAVKEGLIQVIGSYMKLAYRTWNDDKFVNDETVITDFNTLTDGKLSISSGVQLDNLTKAGYKKKSKSYTSSKKRFKSSSYGRRKNGGKYRR